MCYSIQILYFTLYGTIRMRVVSSFFLSGFVVWNGPDTCIDLIWMPEYFRESKQLRQVTCNSIILVLFSSCYHLFHIYLSFLDNFVCYCNTHFIFYLVCYYVNGLLVVFSLFLELSSVMSRIRVVSDFALWIFQNI